MTAAGIYGSHRFRIDDVVYRTVEHQSALMQYYDARRDFAHEVEVMLDQDDREAGFACEMPQDRADGHTPALVRPAVGSSSRMSLGSSARTMATRLFHAMRQKTGGGSDQVNEAGEPQDLDARDRQREKRRRADSARRFGGRAGKPQALCDSETLEDACDLEFAADAERHNAVGREAFDGLACNLDHTFERLGTIAETTD
jgi:hypothetical protein